MNVPLDQTLALTNFVARTRASRAPPFASGSTMGFFGHTGLFMGARTLKEHWPAIARWIAAQLI